MTQEAELQKLVGAIYDAALAPEGWKPALRAIARLLEASAVTLICEEPSVGLTGMLSSTGIEDKGLLDYERHYAELDIALSEGMRHPPGTWVSTADFVSTSQYRETEFYHDFLRPNGLGYVAGTVLRRAGQSFASVGLHRPLQVRPFDRADAMLYQVVQPHLERALAIAIRLATSQAGNNILAELFDRLTMGVVLFDPRGRVLHVNDVARNLAARSDGLTISANEVTAARHSTTTELRSLVAEAVTTGIGKGLRPAGGIALERPSGRRPLEAVVAPLAVDRVRIGVQLAAAVLFIRDPEDDNPPAVVALGELYGLTPTESRFVVQLLAGGTIAETAEALGISPNTAKTHLKSVFAKTETRRQTELVRLLSTGPLAVLNTQS